MPASSIDLGADSLPCSLSPFGREGSSHAAHRWDTTACDDGSSKGGSREALRNPVIGKAFA
jgi:hypothetical protein